MSFSYFIPKTGDISIPVSPFSYRGLGFGITNFLGFETGATLYRISGLGITGVPFESAESMMGPTFTLLVPAELVLEFGTKQFTTRIKAGGFAFQNFLSKLNYGSIDRAILSHENWQVANADFEFDYKPGFGYEGGVEFIYYVNRQLGITFGGNYFVGGSKLNLRGSYLGGNGTLISKDVVFENSKVDFTGLEISIGALFGG